MNTPPWQKNFIPQHKTWVCILDMLAETERLAYPGRRGNENTQLRRHHRKTPEIPFDICTVPCFHRSHRPALPRRGIGTLMSTFAKKTFAALWTSSSYFTWKPNAGIYTGAQAPSTKETTALTQTLGAKIPWFAATF